MVLKVMRDDGVSFDTSMSVSTASDVPVANPVSSLSANDMSSQVLHDHDKAKLTLTDLDGGVITIETSSTLASNAPASGLHQHLRRSLQALQITQPKPVAMIC